MKRLISAAFAALLIVMTGCNQGKIKDMTAQNTRLTDSLQTALANQDSLLVLLNDISEGMAQIRDMEQILATGNLGAETSSRKEEIRQQMTAIQQALQDRRERLAELEAKFNKAQQTNATLRRTIDNLKAEIAQQEATIGDLRAELANAREAVTRLSGRVDTLNATVATETRLKQEAQQEAVQANNELNLCYYAIGSKKELKNAKVLEGGFLRKTKLMRADFEKNYFTQADKRTLREIPTHSKKAKVLTNMPEGSYTIVDVGGNKVLRITNPTSFWSLSNYLVIQID